MPKFIDYTTDASPLATDYHLKAPSPSGVVKKSTIQSEVNAALVAAAATMTGALQSSNFRLNEAVAITATSTEINKLAGMTSSKAELNILTGVTSTAAELNKLDGASSNVTPTNLNTLTAGVASSADALHVHSMGALLHRFYTNVVVASSTSETTLLTCSIPANKLGTGNVVRGRINVSTAGLVSGHTMVFKLKYGGTTIATPGLVDAAQRVVCGVLLRRE